MNDKEIGDQTQKAFEDGSKPYSFGDKAKLDALPGTPIEPAETILQFFSYAHLPVHLQSTSKGFADLANTLMATLPRSAERTVALRKLLESKDCAVRALVAAK